MKNLTIVGLITFGIGLLAAVGMPWWSTAVAGALAGWFRAKSNNQSFWGGFAGGLLLWFLFAFVRDLENDGLLAQRIGALFGGVSRWGILGLTALMGGLLGGFGALTGYRGRVWVSPESLAKAR
ncbi:MAG: hypothetical protein NZM43_00625 [Saprospiraceae bacterium]|nr:hypothetical protein [Saprospiraceae bacterium]MDW8482806.1 hypothetical protein [Saprospiraceae bacterium]